MTNYFERDLRGKTKYRVYNDVNQFIENFLIRNGADYKMIEAWRSNINQDEFLNLINENNKWKKIDDLKKNTKFLFKKYSNCIKFWILKLLNIYDKNKKTDEESPILTKKIYVDNDELTEIPLTTKIEPQKPETSLPSEHKETPLITGWEELGFTFDNHELNTTNENKKVRFNLNFLKRNK